jgi:hypothetical protein
MECPACKEDTLRHLHACAWGMPETHMCGSERFECDCGFYVKTKEDAEEFGLVFVEDV